MEILIALIILDIINLIVRFVVNREEKPKWKK